jgi:hypothetical protein
MILSLTRYQFQRPAIMAKLAAFGLAFATGLAQRSLQLRIP